jgi:hypothetical protein
VPETVEESDPIEEPTHVETQTKTAVENIVENTLEVVKIVRKYRNRRSC